MLHQLQTMIKRYGFLFLISCFCSIISLAQETGNDKYSLLQQAREAFQLKQYAASEEILKLAIHKYPNNISYRIELAQEYRALNMLQASSKILEKTLQDKLNSKEVYLLLSDNYYRKGAYRIALRTIKKGLAIYSNCGLLYEKKGIIYETLQKHKKAIAAYTSGINMDTSYLENYLNLARLEVSAENPEKSSVLAEYYILKNPSSKNIVDAKKILRASYRNWYLNLKENPYIKKTDTYLSLFSSLFKKNIEHLADGIDALSLCKLRSKMAMQAIQTGALPYHLESIWNTLMREGYFEAYHYWLFTAIEDPNTYAAWLQYHKGAEKELLHKISRIEF